MSQNPGKVKAVTQHKVHAFFPAESPGIVIAIDYLQSAACIFNKIAVLLQFIPAQARVQAQALVLVQTVPELL
jgi:hypothetical protein